MTTLLPYQSKQIRDVACQHSNKAQRFLRIKSHVHNVNARKTFHTAVTGRGPSWTATQRMHVTTSRGNAQLEQFTIQNLRSAADRKSKTYNSTLNSIKQIKHLPENSCYTLTGISTKIHPAIPAMLGNSAFLCFGKQKQSISLNLSETHSVGSDIVVQAGLNLLITQLHRMNMEYGSLRPANE